MVTIRPLIYLCLISSLLFCIAGILAPKDESDFFLCKNTFGSLRLVPPVPKRNEGGSMRSFNSRVGVTLVEVIAALALIGTMLTVILVF